jgi:adenylosuccinate lyase
VELGAVDAGAQAGGAGRGGGVDSRSRPRAHADRVAEIERTTNHDVAAPWMRGQTASAPTQVHYGLMSSTSSTPRCR